MTQKIAIACDHGGVALKSFLMENIDAEWIDLGTNTTESVDYPDYGYKLSEAILSGQAQKGIAICGSGIGFSIACNRYAGIRAALCSDTTMARLSREHNDANILCLGARLTGDLLAKEMADIFLTTIFLTTEFDGGRHERRVHKLYKGVEK